MNNKVKEIDIKICAYFFFNDVINMENFHPNYIKKDEKSYKNMVIYYIGRCDDIGYV